MTAAIPCPSIQFDSQVWERIILKIELRPPPPDKGLTTKCWIWHGSLTGSGRPKMKWKGRCVHVTRWMLALTVRAFRKGELALHKCDVKLCVNPGHLEHGTHSKNLKDAWLRKRRFRPNTFLEV